ncbi:alpha/beta hydrolase [Aquimarina aquimarini]|uniref:alpha/beta hydrolase n=1 Tax=Aquimarina aquimarini TaxID=1191734 RepID=UPI000D552017|nr:alpha/beta hydrolase [Aquimarina aquimarini]
MKPKLILLSDLWGYKKSDWTNYYISNLENHFEIQYYDCCKLGELDTSIYLEENLHQQFVNGGINLAVQNLLKLEKGKTSILGFSVGGTIGWKFALKNKNTSSLYAISSTRLRYETNKPKAKTILYYGEDDINTPKEEWYKTMNIDVFIEDSEKHQMYTKPEFAKKLCNSIIKNKNTK